MESYPSDGVEPAPVAIASTIDRKVLATQAVAKKQDELSRGPAGPYRFVAHTDGDHPAHDRLVRGAKDSQTQGDSLKVTPTPSVVRLEKAKPRIDLGPQLGVAEVRSISEDDELPWVAETKE
jgi:hypothetical protein